MKITIDVNGIATEIELTDDQVKKINRSNIIVTDRIKTLEDACEELGITSKNKFYSDDEYGINAFVKLQIIAKALNEGWKPDWSNSSEYKYYPWFDMSSGFSYIVYFCNYSHSLVGSRLCYRTKELAEYAGKQFTDLYKEYFGA